MAEMLPVATSPNANAPITGDQVSTGTVVAVPWPDSDTTCGEPGASLLTMSCPL